MTINYRLSCAAPAIEEYCSLREKTGWGQLSKHQVKTALENSLFHICIYVEEQMVGMARVVGDGAVYFYIQDVVVDPVYQGNGLGTVLMERIETYLQQNASEGAMVGLLSAKGKEPFYMRFGYTVRPTERLGNGMCKFT